MSGAGPSHSGPHPTTLAGDDRALVLPRRRLLRLMRSGARAREYFLYLPGATGERAPVLVAVHGISRNAEEHARCFSHLCEAHGVVLVVPFFGEAEFPDYQRLGRVGHGPRADMTLEMILEEVGRLTGAAVDRVHLFGFSGGAQFVHRFSMAHPHRVHRAVAAAAGWYTFPDRRRPYPYGIRASRELPGIRFDPEEFLKVPITVMVGDRDITMEHLRCTARVIQQQGTTRVDRARGWVAAMQAAALAHRLQPRVSFELIPDGDHVFASLMDSARFGERVFAALFRDEGARGNGRIHD